MKAPPVTGRRVLAIALPVILSNASTPLQGAVDVAVIGRLDKAAILAAVGLGAQIFSLMFGICNFLQIGTSGLTAQAQGAGDPGRAIHTLIRALLVAGLVAGLMILGQSLLLRGGLALFEASAEAEALTARYFSVRIWAAPAELGIFALMGWFVGQALSWRLLQLQILVSILNIALSLALVLGFGWRVEGVALATALASWLGFLTGLHLARRRALASAPAGWRIGWDRVLKRAELARLMRLNRDLFLRTLCLIGCFTWITRLGSLQGDAILAANVVLWQFFQISAHALDGFALSAETLVGQSAGARDHAAIRRAAVISSLWSGGLACVLAAVMALGGGPLIELFTVNAEVRALARDYALWATLIPLIAFAPFQLDGIFVGLAAAAQMRNAMLIATAVYLPLSLAALAVFGNHGVWAGLWCFLLLRAAPLLLVYPQVEAAASAPTASATEA